MSDTPRTDSALHDALELTQWPDGMALVVNQSRQLERELNSALKEIAELKAADKFKLALVSSVFCGRGEK